MSAQLAKELRCMLPVWLMAIVAIGIAAIASSYFGGTRFLINPLCAVTVILLGASSFGCEFQYKTMPMLLSQPLIRAELWYSKMVILGPALLSLSAVAAAVAPYPDGSYLIKLVDRLAIAIMVFGLAPWLTLVARGGLVGAASVFLVCAVNEIIAK